MSKIKGFTQKLGFLKDYSSLVFPIIIALVGVLLFVPTQLMSSKLKMQIDKQSISGLGRSIKNLRGKAVSNKQWELEKGYQQAYSNDANVISSWSAQSTQRSLLSYKIFPEPKDKSRFVFDEFGINFCDGIDRLLSKARGDSCPSEAEIASHLKAATGSDKHIRGRSRGRNAGFKAKNNIESSIIESVCLKRAQSNSFYVNNYELVGYEFWKDYDYIGVDDGVIDSWYWQIGYWIIEDTINSIASTNASSDNVINAPVKRLLELNFTRVSSTKQFHSRSKTVEQNPPHYVITKDQTLTESFTGRLSNDEIDVVHFFVSILVSNKGVMPFMNELCSAKTHSFSGFKGTSESVTYNHNQITILECNLESIDINVKEHELYRYGTNEALFKMNLYCEYILSKAGYEEIKPESVKEQIKETKEKPKGKRRHR